LPWCSTHARASWKEDPHHPSNQTKTRAPYTSTANVCTFFQSAAEMPFITSSSAPSTSTFKMSMCSIPLQFVQRRAAEFMISKQESANPSALKMSMCSMPHQFVQRDAAGGSWLGSKGVRWCGALASLRFVQRGAAGFMVSK
jgi:hypothetical protein